MSAADVQYEGGRYKDANGLFFPWYTGPCLEWLDKLDLKGKCVFEYGIGDSTTWYRSRGAYCIGVDSNFEWAKKNYGIYAASKIRYVLCLDLLVDATGDLFDIVAIDGDFRDNCTQTALAGLKPGGHLIIDNYHQPSVEPNRWILTDHLIKGMPIKIYKQPNHPDWQTAVITKP